LASAEGPASRKANSTTNVVLVVLAATAAIVVAWFAHIIPHH
jgi:hypothetical protein